MKTLKQKEFLLVMQLAMRLGKWIAGLLLIMLAAGLVAWEGLLGLRPAVSAPAAPAAMPKMPQEQPKIPNVLELFTSQSCSSCPPADKLLKRYIDDDSVIALSYSVDYWDYLDWKDTLASPKYSQRQRDYARRRGDHEVYTPQMVVNGIEHAVGSREWDVERAIRNSMKALKNKRVPLRLWFEGGAVYLALPDAPKGMTVKEAVVWVVLTKRKETVAVRAGENAGEVLSYYNVVRDLSVVGMWEGKAKTIKLPRHALMGKGIDGCTVLLQEGKSGPILGAAQMHEKHHGSHD